MGILKVEKIGGLAGFGGARAHIRSRGEVDTASLSAAERKELDSLFRAGGSSEPVAGGDGFRFRISRTTVAGTETIEASEADVPTALASCVKDELV